MQPLCLVQLPQQFECVVWVGFLSGKDLRTVAYAVQITVQQLFCKSGGVYHEAFLAVGVGLVDVVGRLEAGFARCGIECREHPVQCAGQFRRPEVNHRRCRKLFWNATLSSVRKRP